MKLDETFLIVDAPIPGYDPDVLRVGAFQERSYVAGPGCRAVIWVTGCLRRCPGCIKPEFLPFEVGEFVSIDEMAKMVLAIEGLEGVTYSGGEPFEQAVPLANLSRMLKSAGLSIAAYSGYRYEALCADRIRFGPLLDELDVLIDGEYLQNSGGVQLWRGSDNQRIHVLSPINCAINDQPIQEIQVTLEGDRVRITGFPDPATEKMILDGLSACGIVACPE